MATKYIRIKVNSVLIHSQASKRCISFAYSKTYGDAVSTADITIKRTNSTEDDANFVTGKTVQVWMADVLVAGEVAESSANIVFSGYVDDREIDHYKITLKCADRLWLAKLAEKDTYEWASGTAVKTIFSDLLGFVGTGSRPSLTATLNAGTPTPSTLTKYVLENNNIFEKLWELSNIVNWQFYYDPVSDTVIFEPRGTPAAQTFYNKAAGSAISDQTGATNPTTWTGKTINVLGLIKWQSNSGELVNNFTAYGGQIEITKTETKTLVGTLYTINGGATTHPYNVTVTASDAYVFTQGTEYTVLSNGIAFLAQSIVDAHSPGTIDILYTYKQEASTDGKTATDPTSKTNFIQRDKTLIKRNLVDSADINNYITTLLAGFKNPITDVSFEVRDTVTLPIVGSLANVYDGIVGRFLLSSLTPSSIIIRTVKNWPVPTTTVSISTRPLKYENNEQTTFDSVVKIDKELKKTNSSPFFKLDGKTPINENLQFGNAAQLIVPVMHNLASAPYGPVGGQQYYNSTSGIMYFYDGVGKAWVSMVGGAGAISGSGTDTYIPRFTGATSIGNSTWKVDATFTDLLPVNNGAQSIGDSTHHIADLYMDGSVFAPTSIIFKTNLTPVTRLTISDTGISTAFQITSTLAGGTSPFAVTSTTVNTNLNADLLDGNHSAAFSLTGHTHAGMVDVSGSGTANRIAKFSDADTIINSLWSIEDVGDGGDLLPFNNGAQSIGDATHYVADLYLNGVAYAPTSFIFKTNATPATRLTIADATLTAAVPLAMGGNDITGTGHVSPTSTDTKTCGTSSLFWSNAYSQIYWVDDTATKISNTTGNMVFTVAAGKKFQFVVSV